MVNNSQNGQTGRDDGDISGDLDRMARNAFAESARALKSADYDKTVKLFGLFEVDAGVAAAAWSGYNYLTKFASDILAPRMQGIVLRHGAKLGLSGNSLTKAAAAATFGSEALLKSGAFLGSVRDVYVADHKDRTKLVHDIAPLLDDIKGKHSVGALNSVREADNEVIFAHRRRMAQVASVKHWNSWITLAVNAGPNLLMNVKELGSMWEGGNLKEIRRAHILAQKEHIEHGSGSEMAKFREMGGMFVNGLTGPIAERIVKSNQVKLQKSFEERPYSALEMILELQKQVASKPDARSFQTPKVMFASNHRSESYSLEEYIIRILIQHEKDMADISPDHTEIREALKDDLAAAAKPLAEAIRKGDISAMELVRLVGEGKVIKNHGRAIASPEEVLESVRRDVPKQATFVDVDPKKYWAQAGFPKKEAKEAVAALEGEERQAFISWLPHSIRKEIGITDHESKEVDAAMAKHYDRMVADAVMGLGALSDAELEKEGLAKKEIAQMRKASEQIEKKGEKAVHDLKTGPANDHGIEQVLTNWAVPQIMGDKTHFGRVLAQGHTKFDTLAKGAANDDDAPGDKPTVAQKALSKHTHGEHGYAANDHGDSHLERAHDSRMTGTHDRHA